MIRYLSLFLTVTTISGCAVVTSTKAPLTQASAATTAAYYFLPRAEIRIQILQDAKDGKPKWALKYVETMMVPDQSEFFLLDYKKSGLSNDSLTIQLTAEGFLKKVETAVEDKSGEIIVKLAEVGKEVVKATLFPSSVGMSAQVVRDFTFSPSDLKRVNSELGKIEGAKLEIGLAPMTSLSPSNVGGEDGGSCGVCFRPLIPYKLTFFEGKAPVEQQILLLPDGAAKLCLPIERSAFVKKVTNLTFDKGVLTEVHLEKPSEVLGFMDIPVAIVKTIASMPAELIQLKIDYSNKEKDLANARKAEAEAKRALLDYMIKEQEERRKNPLGN